VYNLCTQLSTNQILDEVSKYIKGNVLNIQFEEQRDKDDELASDTKQSARRVYAYIGKINLDITQEVLLGLKKLMAHNSLYEDQVQLLTALPFWTTSRYYYAINKKIEVTVSIEQTTKEGNSGNKKRENVINVNNAGRGGRGIIRSEVDVKKVNKDEEVTTARKGNTVKMNSEGRDKGRKWGETDELQTCINEDKGRKSQGGVKRIANELMDIEQSKDIIIRQGSNEMTEWQQHAENNILAKVMSMLNDNNKEVIEETNRNIEEKLKENNSIVMEQLRKDKEEHDSKMERMMQMQASVYEMMMQMQVKKN